MQFFFFNPVFLQPWSSILSVIFFSQDDLSLPTSLWILRKLSEVWLLKTWVFLKYRIRDPPCTCLHKHKTYCLRTCELIFLIWLVMYGFWKQEKAKIKIMTWKKSLTKLKYSRSIILFYQIEFNSEKRCSYVYQSVRW